uniref:C-terminal of Roc, COR, domain n=1 Tax=Candidatus Kentrum sp. MB TaxID=2138164 RepID=A0A450XX66_9GAMM|nr:MAG: C-terminal of Roc, COR, domain [Candidatus Kentron sp. MB]VFK33863.1 MAG: C-terminal of Roc, COR, domain [Candidatus Kentron sp. MB]VFK76470.1 MAG: C-terminal of Roc, COR, domain [Candidatus Kentron sp. MB]
MAGGTLAENTKWMRVIFIGNRHAVVPLIRALVRENVWADAARIRRGIEVTRWPVDANLTAYLWNFDDEIIANGIYRFFLRPHCVYVWVIDAATANTSLSPKPEDWLEYASGLEADTPILLVGNEWDQATRADMHRRLCEVYPIIHHFDFCPLSSQHDSRFIPELAGFRETLTARLCELDKTQPPLSQGQLAVIEAMHHTVHQDAFLARDAFTELCNQQGIGGREREAFLEQLDRLGKVIYLPDLYRLHDFGYYLLNPRWLVQGVRHVFSLNALRYQRERGLLSWDGLREVIGDREIIDEKGNTLRYPNEKLGFLLGAMEMFRLCYPFADARESKWLVPGLLPNDQPEASSFERNTLRLDFRFQVFVPRDVLNRFIVEHYADIYRQRVWRRGVHLRGETWGTDALVWVDHQEKMLSLEVVGPHVDPYFSALYSSILKIMDKMSESKCERLLHLHQDVSVQDDSMRQDARTDFDDVLMQRAAGHPEYICKFGHYEFHKLLHSMPASLRGSSDKSSSDQESKADCSLLMAFIGIVLAGASFLTGVFDPDTSFPLWGEKTIKISMIVALAAAILIWKPVSCYVRLKYRTKPRQKSL